MTGWLGAIEDYEEILLGIAGLVLVPYVLGMELVVQQHLVITKLVVVAWIIWFIKWAVSGGLPPRVVR